MTTAHDTFMQWQRTGFVSPMKVGDARETLHHAAQLLALIGASYLPVRPDDSHTSMHWLDEAQSLATELVDAARPFRVGLRVHDLTLLFLDASGREAGVFPLAERTRAEGIAWLRARIGESGRDPAAMHTSLHFSIASHPTDSGAPFVRHGDGALEELSRWYRNAHTVLEARRVQSPAASNVRCWPHHFDIATLVTLSNGPPETIGIGMSPGDPEIPEPYFYVSPNPPPTDGAADIAIGNWHVSDWFGGLLTASAIVAVPSALDQQSMVTRFFDGAFNALVRSPKETPP
jgi:hypothetical protein